MSSSNRRQWQLPEGVEPGTWEYVHRSSIADDYDDYFAGHALFQWDDVQLEQWLPAVDPKSGIVVADLGCGTGRALWPVLSRGYQGLAIDLSLPMLARAVEQAGRMQRPLLPLCANLVELDGLCDQSVDHALCLFSTMGMIKGAKQRLEFLRHVARILRPGGRLFLQVHNLWSNLAFPGGPAWIARSWWSSRREASHDWGDKYYAYRGLANMYLHVFRRRELMRLLRDAGLEVASVTRLNHHLGEALRRPWLLGDLRCTGWWIVAECPGERE